MTALSASYDGRRKDGALIAYPVAAGAHVFKGALVAAATGLVQPISDAAGLVFAGVAYEEPTTRAARRAHSRCVFSRPAFTRRRRRARP